MAISVLFFLTAAWAWSGRTRRWAMDRPEHGAFHRLNYLPLKAGVAGVWILTFIPGAAARVSGADAAEVIEFYTVARGGDVWAVQVPLWGPREPVPARARKNGLR